MEVIGALLTMPLPAVAKEELLALAFETSSSAMTISRLRDGLFLEVNKGFAEVTGWPVDDVVGCTALERDIWLNAAEREQFINTLSSEGRVKNMLCRFRRRSGDVFHGSMSGSMFEVNGERYILRDHSGSRRDHPGSAAGGGERGAAAEPLGSHSPWYP